MGSLSLKCPFCCEEHFSSHLSLKYHILSIIDNILCPGCNCRFDSILELTEHLDRECKDKEPAIEELNSSNVDSRNIFSILPDTKINRANDEPEVEHPSDVGLLETTVDTKDVKFEPPTFICEMCNIEFESVEDHLREFHEGEEVILETNDGELLSSQGIKTESNLELEELCFEAPEDDSNANNDNDVLEEKDFVDIEGIAYTRKIVKINKFWTDRKPWSPIKEKYVLENGKVRKVDDEEEEIKVNKDAILEIHRCSKCYLQFPKLDHFQKHICDPQKVKNKNKPKCVYCSSVFDNYEALLTHLKSHLVKDVDGTVKRIVMIGPQICPICKTTFPTFKSLRLHQRMHEPIKDKLPEAPVKYSITSSKDDQQAIVRDMFICGICDNTYDKEYEEVHMKYHSNEVNYICTVCNRKFVSKETLEMHASAHSNTKKFTCSYCKKAFTTYELLENHVMSHCHERDYACQYCGRRFSRPHEKVKHERIHTGEKPHICKICGKAFRVSYCLTLHMRTHSGTRPYQCTQCDKRFKSHSVYNHHLLTHSDVRAYKCPFCPKAFKTAVQLAGHKNSHLKPFNCKVCNRPFASLYAVRAHMDTHKKDNNLKYECLFCGATYARAFALRDHMNVHIKNDDGNDGIDLNEMILQHLMSKDKLTTQIDHSLGGDVENMEIEGI